jgi:hypothetical protein
MIQREDLVSDNEDLQSVLNELQKVLSDLTKEDKEHAVEKIKEREEKTKEPARAASPPAPVTPPVPATPPAPVTPPAAPPATVTPPAAVTPPAPDVPKPPEIPVAKEQSLPPEIPLKGQEIPLVETQETAESPSIKVEEDELRELIPEETAPVLKTQKSAQAPQEGKPAPAPAGKPPEPVKIDEEKEEIEEIPENATMLDYAIFYPTTNPESSETFRKNLLNVVKKTSKKPLYFRRVMKGAVDIVSAAWEGLIKKCTENKAQAVFLIHTDKFDSYELKNKFTDLGIFFQSIPVSQLERRITYVDMVIELMLAKRED